MSDPPFKADVVREGGSVRRRLVRAGVFGERDFALYFAALTTSNFGTAMVPIAITFAVLDQGRSATDVGYVLSAGTAPLVLFLLVGGVAADRYGRRLVMITSDVLRAAAESLLAALLLVGRPSLITMAALSFVVGLGNAFFNPSMSGLITDITTPGNFQQANALRGIASSTGRLFGPMIGGVVVATAGAGTAIAIDAATYVVSAICLLAVRARPEVRPSGGSVLTQLREGWTDFRSRTWLWAGVSQFGLYLPLAAAPFLVLGAVIAQHRFGGATAWGVVVGTQGVGALLAGLVTLRWRPRRMLVVAEIAFAGTALPLVALAFGAPFAVIVAATGVAGTGLGVYITMWTTTMQHEIPAQLMSRVSAYDWFGSTVFQPVGYVVAGPLGSAIGDRAYFLLGAIFMGASSAALASLASVRAIENPGTLRAQPSTLVESA